MPIHSLNLPILKYSRTCRTQTVLIFFPQKNLKTLPYSMLRDVTSTKVSSDGKKPVVYVKTIRPKQNAECSSHFVLGNVFPIETFSMKCHKIIKKTMFFFQCR